MPTEDRWVLKIKYSPEQPRVPSGSSEGGQWTSSGGLPSTLSDLPDWTGPHKLASDISGEVPQSDGRPVPVTTRTLYHVATHEKVKSLLQNGFDITKVKTRWTNDYAMSLNSSKRLDKAMEYFTPNVKGSMLDTSKYWIVAVTVRGRFFDPRYDDPVGYGARSPQEYTRRVIRAGYDASENVFVYNPQAITRIHLVEPDKVAAANEKLSQRRIR